MPLIPRRKSKKPQVAGSGSAVQAALPTKTGLNASNTALAQIPRPNLDSELGSSQPVFIRDVVPELTTQYQRTLMYARMQQDAGVDASLRILKTPILAAEFFVEPYSDSDQDILIAEFIWENLAKGLTAPLLNTLEEILHMCEDGFSVIEKVYENRQWSPQAKGANNRVYTMLKKLAVRPATTIPTIEYDNNGGPVSVTQNAIQADGSNKEVKLPIEKIIIFPYNKKGGDLTGRSILRTAYPHWYYKTHLYKIDAVQKERHGIGVPRGKVLPGAKPNDKAELRTMLRNLRTNEESFIIQTPTIEVDFVELTGRPVDVIKSAEHHNVMTMLNVLAQFMVLGLQAGGGRNTASTGSDMFMKAMKYLANWIAQMFNMYLIPELVVWNFPTNNYPTLKVRNIGETRDLQMLGAALANLFSQQGITPDLETENWIRDTFDMPRKKAGAIPTQPVTREQIRLDQYIGQGPGADQPGAGTTAPGGTTMQSPNQPTGNGKGKKGNVPRVTRTGNVGVPPSGTS